MKTASRSDITGVGHGSEHTFRKLFTVTTRFSEIKGTDYFCVQCGVSFKHLYDVEPNIFDAMKIIDIPFYCGKKGSAISPVIWYPKPELERIKKSIALIPEWQKQRNENSAKFWSAYRDLGCQLLAKQRERNLLLYTDYRFMWDFSPREIRFIDFKQLNLLLGEPAEDFSNWPDAIEHIDAHRFIVWPPNAINFKLNQVENVDSVQKRAELTLIVLQYYSKSPMFSDQIQEAEREKKKMS